MPQAVTVFLAPDGDDAAPGTGQRPVATPRVALELLRRAAGRERRMVVRGGEYHDVHLALTPADSGLIIAAADGETPVWHGGRPVTAWQLAENGWWAAAIPGARSRQWDFRMLTVNGAWRPRARFPVSGMLHHLSDYPVRWLSSSDGGWERKPTAAELATMRFRPEDLPRIEPDNAELSLFHEWDASLVGVATADHETGLLTFRNPAKNPPGAFRERNPQAAAFILWNVREGMSAPGQWFLDRARERLVYWPMPGETPAATTAIAPTRETIIAIVGSGDEPVRDIGISGLTLSATAPVLEAEGFAAREPAGAITIIAPAADIQIANVTVRHVGGTGIKVASPDREHPCVGVSLARCEIATIGGTGIVAYGRQTIIADCLVSDTGLTYPAAAGIVTGGPAGQVCHNEVRRTPYTGIIANGEGLRAEYNRITAVMLTMHDGAAIYAGFAKNMTLRGNVATAITRARAHAYYLDEQSEDCLVENNLGLDTTSFLHGHMGRRCRWRNNVCVNRGELELAFPRCSDFRLENNLFQAQGRIEMRHPDAVAAMPGNLFFSAAGVIEDVPLDDYARRQPVPMAMRDGSRIADPRLTHADPDGVDFADDSPARAMGIAPLDLAVAGRRKS